jgi:hypothetical protein
MEGNRPTDEAKQFFDIAIQVITQARHEGNSDATINKMAWGMRSWLMGEMHLATGLRATYILLETIDKKLDRIEQSLRR